MSGRTRLVGALLALLLAPGGFATARAGDWRALDEALAGIAREAGVVGMAYAVIHDGRIAARGTHGHADQAGLRPITPDTRFRVGSVSKTVTALLAMALVEDGVLSLDTPLDAVLADNPVVNPWAERHPVRLAHLLEHTAGLPGSSFFEYARTGDDIPPGAFVAAMAGRLDLRWPPGRYYSYANAGPTLAARMLEVAAGRDFDTLVRERIFEPLGMDNATFATAGVADLSGSFDTDGSPAPVWSMAVRPAGSLAASLTDMSRLALFLASGETATGRAAPVSAAGLARMHRGETSGVARAGYEYAYGLGMFGFLAADRVFWGHWGRTEGFQANLGVLPDRERGFVLLANSADRRAMGRLRERLAAALVADLPALAPAAAAATPPADALDGLYLPFTHDMALRSWVFALLQAVRVEARDGALWLASPWWPGQARRLVPVGDGAYRTADAPIATHVFFREDGAWRLFGDDQETFRRLADWVARGLTGVLVLAGFTVVASLLAGPVALLARIPGWIGWRGVLGWFCFTAAALGLLGLFVTFYAHGLGAPLARVVALGRPGAGSLLLLLLSLLWPLAALAGAGLLMTGQPSPRVRLGGLMLVAGHAVIALSLALLGWLPLITWRG